MIEGMASKLPDHTAADQVTFQSLPHTVTKDSAITQSLGHYFSVSSLPCSKLACDALSRLQLLACNYKPVNPLCTLQALLLTVCLEQLTGGSCPGKVLEHFECTARALREGGADPLAQQAHYEDDALLIQQVGHPLCPLYRISAFGLAQVHRRHRLSLGSSHLISCYC